MCNNNIFLVIKVSNASKTIYIVYCIYHNIFLNKGQICYSTIPFFGKKKVEMECDYFNLSKNFKGLFSFLEKGKNTMSISIYPKRVKMQRDYYSNSPKMALLTIQLHRNAMGLFRFIEKE